MAAFAAVLTCTNGRWKASEVSVDDCESVAEMGDVLADFRGDMRLLFIEEDDEYAAIIRADDDGDDLRVFLSDGHAADSYPIAEIIAEDIEAVGVATDADDEDVPRGHESAPFGDASIVEDLGMAPSDLFAMCVHPGTLPIDVLVAVCEKAGCIDQFDSLRE